MTILKFHGGISYGAATTGSRGQFWLIDANTLIIKLVSKPWDESQADTHFVAVAMKRSSGLFETPWTYLMDENGETHVDGSALIRMQIEHLDDEMMHITGTWFAGDDAESKYNFDNHLPRFRASSTV